MEERHRILFLYSDTGGGHRSATEAIIEALNLEFPGQFDTRMVDFFTEYYPAPLSRATDIYPALTRFPSIWGMSYTLSDGRWRTRLASALAYPIVRRATRRLLADNPSDLIVSVHPLVNTIVLRAMVKAPLPFVTVVTDMVSTHYFWFDRRADLVIVPTTDAAEIAKEAKVAEGNIRIIGLPVADRFCRPTKTKAEIRAERGWDPELPTVLLVGGGDGMGPIVDVAEQINAAGLNCQLVVICGRNESVKSRLSKVAWTIPAHLYGFVTDMPDFMIGSDMIVTKAGPGTISEAFIAGLPLVLYSRMPGQEEGNVQYVIREQAGVWAPTPDQVVAALTNWVNDPEALAAAAAASARVARPGAARQVARILADHIGVPSDGPLS